MIDWLTFTVPYDGPHIGERFYKDGQDFIGQIVPAFTKDMVLEGSWSARIMVGVIGGDLHVSGNPVKFLTGQNVIGTDDVENLVKATISRIFEMLEMPDCLTMRRAIAAGNVKFTRIDCTYNYEVGSDDDVATWIRAMETCCNVRYRGRGHFNEGMCALAFGTTVDAYGKPRASRRSMFKFYNKHRELQMHKLTCDSKFQAVIGALAYGVVRGEAVYRSPDLIKNKAQYLHQMDANTIRRLHNLWIDKMEISKNVELLTNVEENMPTRLRMYYRAWKNGEDMKAMTSRPTFYRIRRELLEFNIDITDMRDVEREARVVVPVLEVLIAEPRSMEDEEGYFWGMVNYAH